MTPERIQEWRLSWSRQLEHESAPTLRTMLAEKIALCDLALSAIEQNSAAHEPLSGSADEIAVGDAPDAAGHAAAELVARLRVPVAHDDCEDCWYSCATLTCDDQRHSDKCDCGADERNAFNAKVADLIERLVRERDEYKRVLDEIGELNERLCTDIGKAEARIAELEPDAARLQEIASAVPGLQHALGQARFCINELVPPGKDREFTLKIIDAAIDRAKGEG